MRRVPIESEEKMSEQQHDLRGPWYVGPNYRTERNARENDAADATVAHPIAILLTRDQAVNKCHAGQHASCCRYLVLTTAGFECGFVVPSMRKLLDERAASGTMMARSGPCADPTDEWTEAKPAQDAL